MMKRIAFILVLIGLYVLPAKGTTYTAATCNAADVQAMMNLATANGDIVQIPTGSCTWTTPVSWSAPPNAILKGAGSTSIVGGGDVTVITDHL